MQKDTRRAVELWEEAAGLGSIEALYSLGVSHSFGDGFQEDKNKAAEFYKKAAMQGHVGSRHNLGGYEMGEGNFDRAVRHFVISAKMGNKISVEAMKKIFMARRGSTRIPRSRGGNEEP